MSAKHSEDSPAVTWTPQQLITILYSPTDHNLLSDGGDHIFFSILCDITTHLSSELRT